MVKGKGKNNRGKSITCRKMNMQSCSFAPPPSPPQTPQKCTQAFTYKYTHCGYSVEQRACRSPNLLLVIDMKIKVFYAMIQPPLTPGRLVITVPSVDESLGSKTESKDNFTPKQGASICEAPKK